MNEREKKKKKRKKKRKGELDRTTKQVDIRPFGDFPFSTQIYCGGCASSLGACRKNLLRNLRMRRVWHRNRKFWKSPSAPCLGPTTGARHFARILSQDMTGKDTAVDQPLHPRKRIFFLSVSESSANPHHRYHSFSPLELADFCGLVAFNCCFVSAVYRCLQGLTFFFNFRSLVGLFMWGRNLI